MVKLSFQNLVIALKHPKLLANFSQEKLLVQSLTVITDELLERSRDYYNQVSNLEYHELSKWIGEMCATELKRYDYKIDNVYAIFLYTVCRWLKPRYVLETGVGYGISSKFIISSLKDNNYGELFSIDLPNAHYVDESGNAISDIMPTNLETGFLVGDDLKSRWHLIKGDSKLLLPDLLSRLQEVDIFIHDSEHSYKHMMFEFESAWPHVKLGGLLISDDSDYNGAFKTFAGNLDNLVAFHYPKNKDRHEFAFVRKTGALKYITRLASAETRKVS